MTFEAETLEGAKKKHKRAHRRYLLAVFLNVVAAAYAVAIFFLTGSGYFIAHFVATTASNVIALFVLLKTRKEFRFRTRQIDYFISQEGKHGSTSSLS